MKKETKQKIIKIMIITIAFILIGLAIYLPLELTGTLARIDSAEKLKEIILEFGAYSYVIFFILQFLQTTFLPIPAAVTTVAGTLVFGPWVTSGISLLAVILGSLFSFFLGKKVGRKLVVWVAGEKDTIKWEQKLEKGKFVFFLMMLFPLFPDDIICLIVGTTAMTYRFFIVTNIITRPVAIISTCFFGSGRLIPFNGWGIPVWIVLITCGIILFICSFKFQPQIEKFVTNLGAKLSRKKAVAIESEVDIAQKTENIVTVLNENKDEINTDKNNTPNSHNVLNEEIIKNEINIEESTSKKDISKTELKKKI